MKEKKEWKKEIEQMQKEEEYRLTHNVESKFVNKKRNKEKKLKSIIKIHGVMKKKNLKN